MLVVLHDSPPLQSESEQHSTPVSTSQKVGTLVGAGVGAAEGGFWQSRPQAVLAALLMSSLQ